jgi:hypothetical protein
MAFELLPIKQISSFQTVRNCARRSHILWAQGRNQRDARLFMVG